MSAFHVKPPLPLRDPGSESCVGPAKLGCFSRLLFGVAYFKITNGKNPATGRNNQMKLVILRLTLATFVMLPDFIVDCK